MARLPQSSGWEPSGAIIGINPTLKSLVFKIRGGLRGGFMGDENPNGQIFSSF
jgi:hypothetical protein